MYINAENIEKSYSDRLLFRFDSLKIYEGDKIGIIGTNGSGKSTLLKILIGALQPDNGHVHIKCNLSYIDPFSAVLDCQASLYSSMFNVVDDANSGGEIMRKQIAAAFSTPHNLLALDEPTSNLDIEGIDLLNNLLYGEETFLLISHDRQLLENHCNRIIEIRDGEISFFNGTFNEFLAVSKADSLRNENLYNEYLKEKNRLARAVMKVKQKANSIKKTPSRMGNSEARLHRRSSTEIQAKINRSANSISSRLDRLEIIKRQKEIKPIKLDFSLTDPPKNKYIFSCENLTYSYEDKTLFESARLVVPNGKKVSISGANGCGKSTLLRLICENPELIYRVPKAKIGLMSQNYDILNSNLTVLQNVLTESIQSRTVCQNVLANLGFFDDSVQKTPPKLSGGELVRLCLAKLIVSDNNVLILDEPTNFLDMDSIIQVQNALCAYEGTLLFVTHDREFLERLSDIKLRIIDRKIVVVD